MAYRLRGSPRRSAPNWSVSSSARREVMVKITGNTKTVEHLTSHLEYITRNGELTGETRSHEGVAAAGTVS